MPRRAATPTTAAPTCAALVLCEQQRIREREAALSIGVVDLNRLQTLAQT